MGKKRKHIISILLLSASLGLSGCVTTTANDKEKTVSEYLQKYDATIENIEIGYNSAGTLFPVEDDDYRAKVKVSEISDYWVEVSGHGDENYQSTKYISNVTEKINMLADENLMQDCDLTFYSCSNSKDVPVMSFEEFCNYDWNDAKYGKNRWHVYISIWNLSDEEAISYVYDLNQKMVEEGICCEYSIRRPYVEREKYEERKKEAMDACDMSELLNITGKTVYFKKNPEVTSIKGDNID